MRRDGQIVRRRRATLGAMGPERHEHLLAEVAGSAATRAHGRRRSNLAWAFQTLTIIVGGLLFAALLNADHLVDRADKKPYGRDRDLWLALWEPFQEASDALYLNRPRRWLDDLTGHEIRRQVVDFPAVAVAAPATEKPSVAAAAADPTVPTVPLFPADPRTAGPSVAAAPAKRLRTPTTSEPLKTWIGGDSMAIALGGSLSRMASATGLMAPTLDARASTGLTRPDYFDWPAELAEIAAKEKPEVMVVIFGANDSQGIRTAEGKVFQPETEGWRTEYRRRVAGTMDLLAAKGRLVIWVGQPVMESAGMARRMAEINTIFREEAAKRDGIAFFDSWPLFLDNSGSYSDYLPGEDGSPQQMRVGDGVHLSRAGADRLARAILESLDAEAPVLGR